MLAVIGTLLLVTILFGLPNAFRSGGGAAPVETSVYRVDARDADGNWTVYEWGVAAGSHRASVLQSHRRECQRDVASHVCRAVVEATFADRAGAAEHRRIRCQNHRVDEGRLPTGMASC